MQVGDLLFIRFNGNPDLVAVCGRVRGLQESTVYPDRLIRARLNPAAADPDFVELAFGSRYVRDQLRPLIKTAAGQHGISGGNLKTVLLPLPDVERQAHLAIKMRAAAEAAGSGITTTVAHTSDLLDRVEHRILDAGFRGDLVPQDATDEPAEETLARLRQQAEMPASPKVRHRCRAA